MIGDSPSARQLKKLEKRVEPLDVADAKTGAGLARRLAGESLEVLINNARIGDDGPGFGRLPMKDQGKDGIY